MAKLLGSYINGNYSVKIYDDGTKLRYTNDDEFIAEFPENIDLKVTNYCDAGCLYCHEDSTRAGRHSYPFPSFKFFDSLRPHTELAIGGGNPLSYPDLAKFLRAMKERNIICNITINQIHFEKSWAYINFLSKAGLVKGIGVSVIKPTDKLLSLVEHTNNAVFHTILGIQTLDDFYRISKNNKKFKVLILGYKNFRRGSLYKNKYIDINTTKLASKIMELKSDFQVLSFDNLAIEQLDLKSKVSKAEWKMYYMGDDGNHTMYIDLVNQRFARNSTSEKTYKLLDNIDDMFNIIKQGKE